MGVRFWGLAAICLLAGCSGAISGGTTCGDSDGIAVVRSLLQDEAVRRLRSEKGPDGASLFTGATIKAAVETISIELINFRTTRGEGSKRLECEAELVYSVPSERLSQTLEGLKAMHVDGLEALADRTNYVHQANTLNGGVRYSLQPTDDGKAIYAELEQADHHAGVLQQLAAGWLVQPIVRARTEVASASALVARVEQESQEAAQRSAMAGAARADGYAVDQGLVAGPSFDCVKAATAVEHQICQTPVLSELDQELARIYAGVRRGFGNSEADRTALGNSQRTWMRERNACGGDAVCLKESYLQRIDQVCAANLSIDDHPGCIDTEAYRQ
jgi:uncharacterized protein YecT (DUF1311 family)